MPQAQNTDRIVVVSWATVAVATLAVVLVSLVLSPTIVHSATPSLITDYELHDPLVSEFEAALSELFPSIAPDDETITALAERMVRDSGVINDASRGLIIGHRAWVEGEAPLLDLHPGTTTKAALAALRDIGHPLADVFPQSARLEINPIPIPAHFQARDLVLLRNLLVLVGIIGIIAATLRSAITGNWRYFYNVVGNILSLVSLVLIAVALSFPILPLHRFGWPWSGLGELVSAAQLPLLLFAVAGLGAGVFARLWAHEGTRTKVGPTRGWVDRTTTLVEARQDRHGKDQTRREAIDAFFDDRNLPASDTPVTPVSTADDLGLPSLRPDTPVHKRPLGIPVFPGRGQKPKPYLTEGFDQVMAAIERDPYGTGIENDDSTLSGDGEALLIDGETNAIELAQDRLDALERIDGKGSKLRTHMPR